MSAKLLTLENVCKYYTSKQSVVMGLTNINVLPHYQQVKDYTLDGKRLYEDITFADSMGKTFHVFPDGTYYHQNEEEQAIYGEFWRLSNGIMEHLGLEGERHEFM